MNCVELYCKELNKTCFVFRFICTFFQNSVGEMDVQNYLNRIGFKEETEVSLACLTKLQNCHQRSVPFENLDIFTDRKKVLSYEILYEQIVTKKRGGWCHELNGLFSWLLNQLGFNVQVWVKMLILKSYLHHFYFYHSWYQPSILTKINKNSARYLIIWS